MNVGCKTLALPLNLGTLILLHEVDQCFRWNGCRSFHSQRSAELLFISLHFSLSEQYPFAPLISMSR